MVAPSMHASAPIDLNAILVAGGSSSGGPRKHVREMSVDMLSGAHNLFDGMPTTVDDERDNRFMKSIIFEGDAVGLDLDGFPIDHVFPHDYGLEEEDEVDIDGEPLFEDELAIQGTEVQSKPKSRRTKA
ncbi:DNA repair protein rhp54 [Hordeum vulgare]|nr:DNA repair protein rhp54 [Hordeum vulgare]